MVYGHEGVSIARGDESSGFASGRRLGPLSSFMPDLRRVELASIANSGLVSRQVDGLDKVVCFNGSSNPNSKNFQVLPTLPRSKREVEQWQADLTSMNKGVWSGVKEIITVNVKKENLCMLHGGESYWENFNSNREAVFSLLSAPESIILFYSIHGVDDSEKIKKCYRFNNLLNAVTVIDQTNQIFRFPTFFMYRFFEHLLKSKPGFRCNQFEAVWIKIFAVAMLTMNMGDLLKLINNMLMTSINGKLILLMLTTFFSEIIDNKLLEGKKNWLDALGGNLQLLQMLALNFLIASDPGPISGFEKYMKQQIMMLRCSDKKSTNYVYLNLSGMNFCNLGRAQPLLGFSRCICFRSAHFDGANLACLDMSNCDVCGATFGCIDWYQVEAFGVNLSDIIYRSVKYASNPENPLDLCRYTFKTPAGEKFLTERQNKESSFLSDISYHVGYNNTTPENDFLWATLPPPAYAEGLYTCKVDLAVADNGPEILLNLKISHPDQSACRRAYINDATFYYRDTLFEIFFIDKPFVERTSEGKLIDSTPVFLKNNLPVRDSIPPLGPLPQRAELPPHLVGKALPKPPMS